MNIAAQLNRFALTQVTSISISLDLEGFTFNSWHRPSLSRNDKVGIMQSSVRIRRRCLTFKRICDSSPVFVWEDYKSTICQESWNMRTVNFLTFSFQNWGSWTVLEIRMGRERLSGKGSHSLHGRSRTSHRLQTRPTKNNPNARILRTKTWPWIWPSRVPLPNLIFRVSYREIYR